MKIENKSTRNKRIAKIRYIVFTNGICHNCIFFYCQNHLQILGVEDFGIQNVVTSIVSL